MPEAGTAGTISSLRARLLALADAHARGDLDASTYETARRDAERALADAVIAAPAAPSLGEGATSDGPTTGAASGTNRRPSRRLVAMLVVGVIVVAAGGYAFTGSPSLAGLGTPPAPVATSAAGNRTGGGNDREVGLQEIARMVDGLAERLKSRPDDAEGWAMLARSYAVLSRYSDAVPAYRRAVALSPNDSALLADYADGIAAANNGQQNAESLALIDRALKIDPKQSKALALAGTVAFDRGDYAGAAAQWQKIADALPPDGDFHNQVVANIDEARRRAGLPRGSPPPAMAAVPTAPASTALPTPARTNDDPARSSGVAGRSATAPSATPGPEALTGTVTLAPALASQVAPTDTVFVLARPEGARMPLAVFRATVKDLPLAFTLDDSMAMAPTMKISGSRQVVVAARISKSGNAISEPGDLAGEVGPVAPGTRDLAIRIATVVPAR